MADWYWVPIMAILIVATLGFMISTIVYLIEKADPWDEELSISANKGNAERVLFFMLGFPAAFLWPVLVPAGFAFLIYKVLQDVRK
jgi:hypothetical protein